MELKMLDMKKIVANPLQPRQEFDREKLCELANSIKEGELLQPIVVRYNGGNFEIVAGERRYKAFQILKEPKIPAIIRNIKDDTDALEKSLIENLQREDLKPTEREGAISHLWKSGRYKSISELERKAGVSDGYFRHLINAKEFRDKTGLNPDVSSTVIHYTSGLTNEVRKKIIEKIPPSQVFETARKIKEFSKPEQQLEILDDFEEAEEQTREVFEDIIQKKKEIVEGKREPVHIIEIESDSDKRMLISYKNIKQSVFGIYFDHIKNLKYEKTKQEAIGILWDIHNYTRKQLVKLGEIKEVKS